MKPADQRRLVSLLGRLASDREEERAAAAMEATRFLQQRGLTRQQAINPPPAEHKMPLMGTWRRTVERCLERPGHLRAWEVTFLHDVPKFRRLPVKVRYVIAEIAGRVLPDTER